MKIGQISFIRMTTPADVPYGSAEVGSKYQGQRGPRPSRYGELRLRLNGRGERGEASEVSERAYSGPSRGGAS